MNIIKYKNTPSFLNNIDQWLNIITNDVKKNSYNLKKKWEPNFEIIEQNNKLLIIGETAGFNKKNINIEYDGEILKIWGERIPKYKNTNDLNKFSEINYGFFEKSFKLHENYSEDKINAKMKDGILIIEITKEKNVVTKTKKIKIN